MCRLFLFFAMIAALTLTGVSAKDVAAKEEEAFWYNAKTFSASRDSKDLSLGAILLVEWEGKKTVVIVDRKTGNFMLSEPAAEMLGMKRLGKATVEYKVIARSRGERKKVRGLLRAQIDRILSGDDVADVVDGVIAVGKGGSQNAQKDAREMPRESAEPAASEEEDDNDASLPERAPKKKREAREGEKFPLLASGTKKDDSWRNNDPLVFRGINFAARVAGAAYSLSADEVKLVEQMFKGVCGIESKCNPTFIHYTPSGGLSRYQGIGQLGRSEVRRAHRTLKGIAEMLPRGVLRNTLEDRVGHFDSIVAGGFSARSFTRDPRFDPLYGSLMLMALHANRYDGTNLIRAILRTFPATLGGEPVMYAITKEGVVIDTDGTLTPTQVHIGVLQSAQLNPVGIVGDDGLVALDAGWTLNRVQNNANALLLRKWIVKPGEGAFSTGVVFPDSAYPNSKKEAIARIIMNSAAKYYVSHAGRDDAFRKKHLSRFAGVADIYLSSAHARARDTHDPTARRFFRLAQEAVAEIGWAVRALLFDEGYNVYVRSEQAKTFRRYLAAFRKAYYLDEGELKEQIKRVESLRTIARKQLELTPIYAD